MCIRDRIKLVPVHAPYFDGARLLIAADCTAYAYAAFHERFIKGQMCIRDRVVTGKSGFTSIGRPEYFAD